MKKSALAGMVLFAAMLSFANPLPPASGRQRVIEWVDRMPNQPPDYEMRDWKKVARDLDSLMFDWDATGSELPIIGLDTRQYNYPWDSFGFGSYIGVGVANAGGGMGPRTMINGVLAGVDKHNQDGHDYYVEVQQYYNKNNGYNIYWETPNASGVGGNVAFYLYAHNNLSFYELYDGNSDVTNFPEQFAGVANKWYDILGTSLGGLTNGWANFIGIGGVDLNTMQTFPGQCWEDTSAAFGYLQYMAWRELGDPKYLDGVDWCMNYLLRQQVSQLQSFHMSYAPYVASRRNMETDDRRYDEHKLVTWCFEPDPSGVHPMYGMHLAIWSNSAVQPYGLIGGVNDGAPDKALPPGTFNTALSMKALVKYDDRYARVAGKWLLHAANSSRLYYPNSLGADHQQPFDKSWADQYDTNYCVSYEQLQEFKTIYHFPSEDLHVLGTVSNDISVLDGSGSTFETLSEVNTGSADGMEHIWRIACDDATARMLCVMAQVVDGGDADNGFDIYYAIGSPTNYTRAFILTNTNMLTRKAGIPAGNATNIYIKAVDRNRVAGNTGNDQLIVDCVYIETDDTNTSPYMTGPYRAYKEPFDKDAKDARNLALYLAIDVGRLAAGFGFTDVDQILSWDLNAADFFKEPCYPTHLYYNPYPVAKTIHVDVGATPVDLYDTVTEAFVVTGATGTTAVTIPSDTAYVVVQTPGSGEISYPLPYRMAVDGVVVDYLANQSQQYLESFENGWPVNAIVNGAVLTNGIYYNGETSVVLTGTSRVTFPIKAAGLVRLEVAYARYLDGIGTNDDFFCEFYDGQTWSELEHCVGMERAPDTTWKMKYIDLPKTSDRNDNVRVRFRASTSQGAVRLDLLTVTAVSIAPVAEDQSRLMDEDDTRTWLLSATDLDSTNLTYAILTNPAHGILGAINPVTLRVPYTPETNYYGSDSFTWTVSDGVFSSTGTVSLTIRPVNDAPEADSQNATTSRNTAGNLSLTATDIDSANLTYAILTNPSHGTLSGLVPSTGAVTYTPALNYTGADSFTFTVSDGDLSSTGAVDITVRELPLPWVSVDIGSGILPGSTTESNGVYTLEGSGKIINTADSLQYAYQTLNSDGEIRLRILSFYSDLLAARFGVMMRDNLTEGSKMSFMGINGNSGYYSITRTNASDSVTISGEGAASLPNVWVRLVRSGDTITAYKSTDGVTWTETDSSTITMAANCYLGICVASGATNSLATATFDSLTVIP